MPPPPKHLDMLCDVGELFNALAGSDDLESFLQQIVAIVARHFQADICSIYFYDEASGKLVLQATQGLNTKFIGALKLKLGEGLAGLALKELRTIHEDNASRHPLFKYIPGIQEEGYDAYLAVPIVRGLDKIGVLVAQRPSLRPFSRSDAMALRAISSQLAGTIENTRLLIALHGRPRGRRKDSATKTRQSLIKGKAGTGGIAVGTALIIRRDRYQDLLQGRYTFDKAYTLAEFEAAVQSTAVELQETHEQLERELPEAASMIFSAHLLMLKDDEYTGKIRKRIEAGKKPPAAIIEIARQLIRKLDASSNSYIREKVFDVEDLTRRLLSNLLGDTTAETASLSNRIIIARNQYLSDIVRLASNRAAGLVLVRGGVTSHFSIIARSLDLPLIMCDDPSLLEIQDNTPLLLDAEVGNLYIHPTPNVIETFRVQQEERRRSLDASRNLEPGTATRDGCPIRLLANINLLSELPLALDLQAEGVGLYRSEFPFLIRQDFPSEEEQVVIYGHITEQMAGKEITIRTLDLGGDKLAGALEEEDVQNPFLGLRSIRFSLRNQDLFKHQLRAILRAGSDTENLKIMFPMISSIDEFMVARGVVETVIEELKEDEIPHQPNAQIGTMIEVPSTIEIIDELCTCSDFLCIGTNDLIQYMLAVDRTNEQVADYYQPHHPAVLRALKRVVTAADRHGKDVSICGEMAHDTQYLALLIGIGFRILSLDPRYLPQVTEAIANIDLAEAEALAEAVLMESSTKKVEALLGIA